MKSPEVNFPEDYSVYREYESSLEARKQEVSSSLNGLFSVIETLSKNLALMREGSLTEASLLEMQQDSINELGRLVKAQQNELIAIEAEVLKARAAHGKNLDFLRNFKPKDVQ